MFVDEDDFTAMPYSIPVSQDAPEALSDFIPRIETEALRMVLGSALYDEFINGLFTNGNLEAPIPEIDIEQKWKDLRDGGTYTIGVKEYRYDGVVNFLVPYIFQQWIVDNFDNLSTTGVSQSTVENAVVINPSRRIGKAYRAFAKAIGNYCHKCDTLYGFLYINSETYPNWNFTNPGSRNQFSL